MSIALLLTAACGAEDTDPATDAAIDAEMPADQAGMDHGTMQNAEPDGMAMAQGRVVDLPGANRVRIDHGPIEAVGMAAMTMTFEAKSGVDLSGVEAGDEVHFLLDRGRDGTFRLDAVCDTDAADHEACMAAMMAKR